MTSILQKELQLPEKGIKTVLSLINEGATVPFIARYRKDMTGGLDEVEIQRIKDRAQYWGDHEKRKISILESLENQGLLSSELKEKIENALSTAELEDIYLPFRPKRKTKGQKAIDMGLKPLAITIQKEHNDFRIEDQALRFVKGEVESEEEALAGAISILAEWISEIPFVRARIREQFETYALVSSKVKKGKEQEGATFKDYFTFSERLNRIASHRVLALLRGEKESILNLKINVDEERAIMNLERWIPRSYAKNGYVLKAIKESYKRILQPSFESEFKKQIKEKADLESINVFANNLDQLLLQSPLGRKNILALDPGFKTGCKVAVINNNGVFLENGTIFPHPPQNKLAESESALINWVRKYNIEALAIGDGTAGLETFQFCKKIFKEQSIQVFLVNEAGASVYSASALARDEFPDLDVTVRGAISIGRRLMDPLAELVKIDPKSIGVGQYQHDVNQVLLKEKLNNVVEKCVNHVGVDLNTASYPILTHISGLGPTIAKNIVAYRNDKGSFKNRKELMQVPKLGAKAFEQAAGFLRVENGDNILDNTIIHPESYKIVQNMARLMKSSIEELFTNNLVLSESEIDNLKSEFGENVIELIINEIKKPVRDPRKPLEEAKQNDLSSINDLKTGMVLNGTVNNITNFGAFVNIGIKESGLVHVSQISDQFIKDIQQVLKLNQQVKVKVLEVDLNRKRIQLTMKGLN